MSVYVIRDGQLVEKHASAPREEPGGRENERLPAPHVSRMAPFESPVTGKEITSWRARDADMKAAGAVDIRDLGPNHSFRRGRQVQLEEAASGRDDPSIWR